MRHFFSLCICFLLGGLLIAAGEVPAATADEKNSPAFREILAAKSRETFDAVAEYVKSHPDAPDAEQAYIWLFENAASAHFEVEALPVIEQFLAGSPPEGGLKTLAEQVQGLGLAKSGKTKEALEVLDAQIQRGRFRTAGSTMNFGLLLANQLQVHGEMEAVREVYERLSDAFPLNPEMRELAGSKLTRLELVGKPAPAISAKDLEGKPVSLADYTGKVVLIDFWATNCAPCLEEMPRLKALYEEFHESGFEILGISLDEDDRLVESFREQAKIPWRQVMHDDEGEIGKPYGVPTIPALFLLNGKGEVVHFDLKGDDLRAVVARLMKQQPK